MGSQHAGVKGVPRVSKQVPILGLTYDHVPSQAWVKDPSIVFLAATKSFLVLRHLMCDWQGGLYVISERRNIPVSLKDKQTFLIFTPVPNWYTTEHMDAEERSTDVETGSYFRRKCSLLACFFLPGRGLRDKSGKSILWRKMNDDFLLSS